MQETRWKQLCGPAANGKRTAVCAKSGSAHQSGGEESELAEFAELGGQTLDASACDLKTKIRLLQSKLNPSSVGDQQAAARGSRWRPSEASGATGEQAEGSSLAGSSAQRRGQADERREKEEEEEEDSASVSSGSCCSSLAPTPPPRFSSLTPATRGERKQESSLGQEASEARPATRQLLAHQRPALGQGARCFVSADQPAALAEPTRAGELASASNLTAPSAEGDNKCLPLVTHATPSLPGSSQQQRQQPDCAANFETTGRRGGQREQPWRRLSQEQPPAGQGGDPVAGQPVSGKTGAALGQQQQLQRQQHFAIQHQLRQLHHANQLMQPVTALSDQNAHKTSINSSYLANKQHIPGQQCGANYLPHPPAPATIVCCSDSIGSNNERQQHMFATARNNQYRQPQLVAPASERAGCWQSLMLPLTNMKQQQQQQQQVAPTQCHVQHPNFARGFNNSRAPITKALQEMVNQRTSLVIDDLPSRYPMSGHLDGQPQAPSANKLANQNVATKFSQPRKLANTKQAPDLPARPHNLGSISSVSMSSISSATSSSSTSTSHQMAPVSAAQPRRVLSPLDQPISVSSRLAHLEPTQPKPNNSSELKQKVSALFVDGQR